MIKVEGLSKTFEDNEIFSNVNLNILEGDFATIYGPSGAGKTTLLNILGMIEKFDSGRLMISGVEVTPKKKDNKEIQNLRKDKISYLFQNFGLLEDKSIYENLKIPFTFTEISKVDLENKMKKILEKVGLNKKLETKIYTLSGGEQQRVAIAKALLKEPKILFADEPTGSLDDVTSGEIIDLLVDINKEDNVTIVMVTHDEKIKERSSRIIYLNDL